MRRLLIHAVWTAALAAALGLAAGSRWICRAAAEDWEGKLVTSVAVRSLDAGPAELPADDSPILQRAGQPYSTALIRQSIERLYQTGRFTDIQVDASPDGPGVAVTFLTRGRYFVGAVTVEGAPGPPSENQLRGATQLMLGQPFSDDLLAPAIDRMRAVLQEDGYYQAQITVRQDPHPDTRQLDLAFTVRPGEQARIEMVRFTGTTVLPDSVLRRAAKWQRGKKLSSSLIQNGLARLRQRYREREYLQAQMRLRREFDPKANRVNLTLDITAGTPVRVTVTGAEISRSRLEKLVPIFQEGSLDEDLLREGSRNLLSYFESQGYYGADVNYSLVQRDGYQVVEYRAVLGDPQSLTGIQLSGNRYFRDDVIRERMQIQTATTGAPHGRFSGAMLDQDLAAIRSLYHSNGFADVSVKSSLAPTPGGDPGEITVFIQIDEGVQHIIRDLAIDGNRSFSAEELAPYLNAAPGQPYSESLVASDRNNILTFYWNDGFTGASFEAEAVRSDGEVSLRYHIDEGQRQYVRHIFVSGLEHTRPGIVNRQLQLHDGDPLSQGAMLETQRRLYDLGIFSRVDIAIQNELVPEQWRTVLINVEEARRYTLRVGLGAEVGRFGGGATTVEGQNQFSPDISLDITKLNVGGRPHTAALRTRFSTVDKRAALAYTAPRFLNHEGLNATAQGLFEETRDVRTFSARRLQGSIRLEDRYSRATTLSERYEFRRVSIDQSTLKISPDQIPLQSLPVLVGLLGTSWIRDTRDSPTDARQGMFNSLDASIAMSQLGSETTFLRSLLQNSSYHRIRGRFIFARSTQFGVQTPFGKGRLVETSSDPTQPPVMVRSHDIPLAERFFAGGGSSHRGFGLNQAGPRDLVTGFALGGNALLVNSLELRFPVWGESLRGVVFHDMGNVYRSIRSLSLRLHQPSLSDFNYASHAVGVGVWYQTPVGPLRIDVGYNLNPVRFQVLSGGVPEPHSLSRWQALFSIGQAF